MDDLRTTINFVLETRRKYVDGTQTPWRIVFNGTMDEVYLEREAHIMGGYDPDNLRVVRITRIEEVWNP